MPNERVTKDLQLKLQDISVSYGRNVILNHISIDIFKGDYIGIIGPNGAGKSTLIKAILGLIPLQKGAIQKSNTLRIGYVPQYSQFEKNFPITVMDTILMGSITPNSEFFHRHSKSEKEKAVALAEFLHIEDCLHKNINNVSGGQMQKSMIARAMIQSPDILILDEPTSNVDNNSRNEIYDILRDINKTQDTTVLLISHDIGAISAYVKSVACLNQTLHYHPERAFTGPEIERTFDCPIDLIAHGAPHRVLEQHDIVDLTTGRPQ
ncbi:metal ABC transporter ATP-binding protein [Fusibacter sp. 3D3]|uniref:metal ABC transporter ATP-binding protein n=1 Tax=Fusibacter sp. 3D3 TaxID=1048380 RepID=UPI00085297A1|nr:metal ABC transporter ATP-binding protein [Fusibacter sp. 3D3]GAU75496.1 zinc ABC transporter, ATP-binding protein ZnuC [Fusibacter sp. 3D3]